jgi:hypothetical protein
MLTLSVVPKKDTDGQKAFFQFTERITVGDLSTMFGNVSFHRYDIEELQVEQDKEYQALLMNKVHAALSEVGYTDVQILDIVFALKKNGLTFMEE